MYGESLGIVGMGAIGSAVARRARGFDMRIRYTANNRRTEAEAAVGAEFVPDLKDLLGQSDFVSLHVPLTPTTHNLIGAAELATMRPTAFLINTSRGDVVDTAALLEALRAGRIAGAGLDVTAPEPIPRRPPVADPAERRGDAAYRQREPRDTASDGDDGSRERHRGVQR